MAFKFIQLMCDDCQLLELLTIPTYCNLFRTCKAFGQCLPPACTFYSCHLCHCFTTSIKQCSNKPSIKVEGLPVCRNPHRHGTMFDCSVMQHLPQGFQPVLATSEMEEVAAIPHLIIVNDFAFLFLINSNVWHGVCMFPASFLQVSCIVSYMFPACFLHGSYRFPACFL